jgi:lipoprotein-anchoring transpeptidase ErfK/SrfK
MSKHRATEVRPRYARLSAALTSLAVTVVAVLGGFGVLPVTSGQANASDEPPAAQRSEPPSQAAADDKTSDEAKSTDSSTRPGKKRTKKTGVGKSADSTEYKSGARQDTALPEGSGKGRRVVYSESRQRVWLVEEYGSVARTYLVSGSVFDNLDPGAFNVYSRSEDAWGVDNSGSMKYLVRFTQGDTGAAIGFHDIPVKDGRPAQSESQLGTPRSHGCIRQKRTDAIALWDFAPLGTSVIVTA